MYKSIRGRELKGMIGRVKIVDIRKNFLYKLGSIPTSRNIPITFLLEHPEDFINKDEEYYIYCTQGIESVKACDELSKKGYKVVNVIGGYHDYLTN